MKNKLLKKLTSVVLTLAMTVSLIAVNIIPAFAADSPPMVGDQKRKDNQPKFSGYRIWDIRDWTPEEDPGAEFLRAEIPLQKRNDPFKPTQVNPELNSDAEIMLMQGDYGNAFVDGMMYNNTFSYHTLNYWQYVDYFSPWHGAATANSPEDLHDWDYENTADRGWEKRYFEFGILNIPNPAYTNAAHRNGVKSIACIYFDQHYRPGQTINELYVQDADGTFPVAEKLIEMAAYFGYDGYFFNCEETTNNPEGQKKFLARLAQSGLWTQYYDTNSAMNEAKSKWLHTDIDGVDTKLQDSVFVNYGWPGNIEKPGMNLDYIATNNLDPFKQVFYGVEANQGKFSGGHATSRSIPQLYAPGTKNLRASLALFTPSDFYQRTLSDDLGLSGRILNDNDYQWMIAERERMYFSGVLSDPTKTGHVPGASRPDVGVTNASQWVGVADFASERSVVNGTTFYTNFNTGKGMQYFSNGSVSRDEEWSNINIQNILPSWQWWIDVPQIADPDATPENPDAKIDAGNKLKVDFDYGEKYFTGAYDYTKIGGYNGGSSLVVAGNLDVENFLRLYKTDININSASKISVTYNKPSASDGTEMKFGLIFKDAPNTVEYITIPNSGTKTNGWQTKTLDLSAYAGKELATIGLAFNPKQGAASQYQMNVGNIAVADNANYTPAQPTGFKVDRMFSSDELIVKWDMADFKTVDNYEIYATLSSGKRIFVGGIYDSTFYIKSLLNENKAVGLELVAVGKDGSKSAPAKITFDFVDKVSNVKVAEEIKEIIIKPDAVVKGTMKQADELGVLNVSWTNPTVNYKALELIVTMDDSKDKTTKFTKTVAKGVTSTQIVVPRGHGEKYNLAIRTILNDGTKTQTINVTGKLKDVYVDQYDPSKVTITGKNAVFWCPDPNDWFKIHVTVNGKVVNFNNAFGWTAPNAIRAGTRMNVTLPFDNGVMQVILEDYAGNFSKPTIIPYFANPNAEITSAMVPDEVLLNAIKAQAGTTIKAVTEFSGTLNLAGTKVKDLTGIGFVSNAKEIILKNTDITEISAGTFAGGAVKLDLSNCSSLTTIGNGALSGLRNLKELDITGSNSLTVLSLSNTRLEKLVYGQANAFDKLVYVDMSKARFDMTIGTPERVFVEAAKAITANKENLILTAKEKTNLALGVNVVKEKTTIGNANLLFDGITSNYAHTPIGTEVVVDFGIPQAITGYELIPYSAGYAPDSFSLYYSLDGNEYTLLAENTTPSALMSGDIAVPQNARYLKAAIAKTKAGYCKELRLFGYAQSVYEAGIKFDGQRPVAYKTDLPKTLEVKVNNGTLDVSSIMSAKTIRGTEFSKLSTQDFVDENYDIDAQIFSNSIFIKLTDASGNVSTKTIDTSKNNTYKAEFIDFNDSSILGKLIGTTTIQVGSSGGSNPSEPSKPTNPISQIPTEKIIEQIKNENAKTIVVDLTKSDIVSKEIFQAAKDTGKQIVFNVVNEDGKTLYKWTFDGKSIKDTSIDVNLELKISDIVHSKNEKVNKLSKNGLLLSFSHTGALPSKANVTIYVGDKYKDGEKLDLHYHNEKASKIELISKNLVVKNGYVTIAIDHCSDYILTKAGTSTNPGTGDTTNTIPLLVTIVLCGGVLVFSTRKLNKETK